MKSWRNNHIVLSDEPVLLDSAVKKADPEIFNACSTANFWIEKVLENSCSDDEDDATIDLS